MRKPVELNNLEELEDDKAYSVSYLSAALKLHQLPYSVWWIKRAERKGMLPRPGVSSYQRMYTGALIKELIKSLLNDINK